MARDKQNVKSAVGASSQAMLQTPLTEDEKP